MRSFETTLETSDELAAVNDILAAIGEPPVSTLEGDSNADVASARRILNKINRQIQSRGYTFNIEENSQLIPDVFNRLIPYMSDYLSILSSGGATAYVNRGGYVYDRTTNTDKFDGPITVTIIKLREYYEMPECFQHLIVTKAARRFNNSFFGAPEIDAVLAEEEQEAKIACAEYELDFGNFNMLDGDAFVGGLLSR